MSALLYEKAFILTAGESYDTSNTNVHSHITNLSVNKKFLNHPGQVPCDLTVEYPQVTSNIILISS